VKKVIESDMAIQRWYLVQLEDAERRIEKLEIEKRELVEDKQTLETKLRRGSEAIKKVSKEQEKLEYKLQKLSSDRDAAVAENKASKAKVTSLEVHRPAATISAPVIRDGNPGWSTSIVQQSHKMPASPPYDFEMIWSVSVHALGAALSRRQVLLVD
jgi:seryl-tRNA synthetase